MTKDTGREAVARSEFFRRTGALGIAGAAVLGFPLLETRSASAGPLGPARDVIAAGGGATVKLGCVDSFSGVFAAAGASHESGMRLAIAEAEKKNSRIKYSLITGDDAGKPAVATIEAKRLIAQERVDTLMGAVSSAVGLAVSSLCQENGVLFIAVGTHDTNITGAKANRVCFRACPDNAMLANAVGPALLKEGKKWYFIVADYAFGNDAHERLRRILLSHGGVESGFDLHPLGATEFSPYMIKARNTDAQVIVFCNYGGDLQNASKAVVEFGLQKKMKVGGIAGGNEFAGGMPVDDLVGATFGLDWGWDAGGRSKQLYDKLKLVANGFPPNWSQYYGYITVEQIIDRMNAVGNTNAEALVNAFEDHRFDAYKGQPSAWRKCDHQNVQEVYAARILPKSKRPSEGDVFGIFARVGGDFAAGSCSNADSVKAAAAITSQTIRTRSDYQVVKLK